MVVPRGTLSLPAGKIRDMELPGWTLPLLGLHRTDGAGYQFLKMAVVADNSIVRPGSFAGLDLESGRGRRLAGEEMPRSIRARCNFASGQRAVDVFPAVQPGDLYCITRTGCGGRASRMTLQVLDVFASRLLDLGAFRNVSILTPDYCGDTVNPWMWMVRIQSHPYNVARLVRAAKESA